MSKHTVKHSKKAVRHGHAARDLHITRDKRPTQTKKSVRQSPMVADAGIEEYVLEVSAPQLQLVELETSGEPEGVVDVVELVEVEALSDSEDAGPSDEPRSGPEDSE